MTTQDTSKPEIAAAITTKGDAVLMIRRRQKEGTLLWAFPSGGIEPGETPEAAAVRETAEEVGVTVSASTNLGTRVHPATGRTMHYVACTWVSGDEKVLDSDEVDEVRWVTHPELPSLVPHGLFAPVQEHLDATLNG